MKHIKEILAKREHSLHQLSLLDNNRSAEKGSSEWNAFNSIVEDTVGAYRVATPIAPQPRYANVIRIRRFRTPHTVFSKTKNAY